VTATSTAAPLVWLLHRTRQLGPQRSDLEAARRSPGRDVVAGVTVAVVALPLALAFGMTSGMGAAAGLVTAVVAGIVAALFGGSNLQVSGPTGAMTVVLVPIVAEYGADGVLVVGLLAGLMLVAMAYAGIGRHMKHLPLPVLEGFTFGIAVLIGLQQVPAALGVESDGEHVLAVAARATSAWFAEPRWVEPLVAGAVALLVLAIGRWRPVLPGALVAVVVATVAAVLGDLPVDAIGAIPSRLPAPAVPDLAVADLRVLIPPALAVAVLGALESLLSATVADAMSVSERHDPDRELFGQGLANLAVPLVGGIPATAAIARTAVNVRSGAHSRLAAVWHGVVLLIVVLTLTPLVAMVPLAALAGVLVATAIRMVEVAHLRSLLRAGRSDATVLVVTFLATVVVDLATAVVLGVVLAGALALRQIATTAGAHEFDVPPVEGSGSVDHHVEEDALLADAVVAYRLEGPLFFGAAHSALLSLTEVSEVKAVVLRMSHVTALDVTAARLLADILLDLDRRGVTVLVSGLPDRFRPALAATGALDRLEGGGRLFATTPEAIRHARALVSDGRPARVTAPPVGR
jgi:sulfate permease, SulP family